ncbi:MAG: hypothetical protein LRY40_05620 [Shewanella fodinae]|nr:hypothetical protein [Shewanella fodinae]
MLDAQGQSLANQVLDFTESEQTFEFQELPAQ